MKIKIWDIFKWVFKWKHIIVFAVILGVLASVLFVRFTQSYTSQVIIRYNDKCISEGRTPDEKAFDPYEIASPDVLTEVISDLSLDMTVDNIRSKITVTPIIPESVMAMQEAKVKLGEEYPYNPVTYSISYAGIGGESEGTVRDILDSIIQNYLIYYQSNYASQVSINDVSFDEEIGDYDYIEVAEIIDDKIDTTISTIDKYISQNSAFRSPSTGLTFTDIKTKYQELQDIEMANLFTDIYRAQVTRNKSLLIEKYTERKENYLLVKKNNEELADLAKSRMDKFAEANINVPNSYNYSTNGVNDDKVTLSDDVYGYSNVTSDGTKYKTKTTYDTLIENYIGYSKAANNAKINSEHCDEIIDKFTSTVSATVNIETVTESVETQINDVKAETKSLYSTLGLIVDDYNQANAATHIDLLTSVQYYATKSQSLFTILFAGAALFVSGFFVVAVEVIKVAKNKKETEDTTESAD